MRHPWLLLVALLWACSGGSSSDEPTDTASTLDGNGVLEDTMDDQTGSDAALPSDSTTEDTQQPIEYPVPAQPVPELAPGIYAWSDGTNDIMIATGGDSIFLLSASFQCEGNEGCLFSNNFSPLSCNKAYEKGYHGAIADGVFVIEGIKGTDKLVGAIQGTDTIALVYELKPEIPCCTKTFALNATWDDSENCEDFDQPDCDIYTDANCEEGLNCILNENEQPVCLVAGEVPVGETCATQGVCLDGKCMALSNDDKNHCYKYCQSNADCPDGSCLTITGSPWKVCSLPEDQYDKCNILDQDCADPNQACYTYSSVINDPICLKVGTSDKGEQCTQSSDCKEGFDCIGGSTCRRICSTAGGEPSCDSPFASCVPLVPSQGAGYCGE